MQTGFTEDQNQFREVVDRFLQEKSKPTATRKLIETESGYDQEVWQQMSGEVGLVGTHIPEAYGGFGFGPIELGITQEEMGRHLYTGPFFASAVMASYALLHMGDEDARLEYLPEIAAGTTIATFALDSLNGPEHVGHNIAESGGALSGTAPLVVDGQIASLLIVAAGTGLFAVQASDCSISPVIGLDPTRKLSRIDFNNTPARKIGNTTNLNTTWDHLCVALAHEMVGGAQQLLDTTIEYTKMRYQFGRPIGSFQGLKHRIADLLMEVEWAKAATHHAARCLAQAEEEREGEAYLPSMVKAMASDTYIKAAKEAIQMRGGIGFTWEEDTQLWYKRAKSSEVFLGTASYHRERMMSIIEQDAEGVAA